MDSVLRAHREKTTGTNPTDRGKPGTKRHMLVDKRIPLSSIVTEASKQARHEISPSCNRVLLLMDLKLNRTHAWIKI